MTVAMVASEMTPYAKTGGLADVLGALPAALQRLGVTMHVFIPRYGSVKEKASSVKNKNGVVVHFITHGEYFNREGLYGNSQGDYPDNLERFSYFSRQVLVQMKEEGLSPDILHAHDWQAALAVVYLSSQWKQDHSFSQAKTVFTIHNLAYQGIFPKTLFQKLGLPSELFQIRGLEFYDRINLLKGGLIFARALTTVSSTYAKEIQTPEQGESLDGLLRERRADLRGILNGIDQENWNPATDKALVATYDQCHLERKAKNKAALQKEVKLPLLPKTFLIGMVSRLADQKGFDLLLKTLPALAKMPLQLVILGSGDQPIQEALRAAERSFPFLRVQVRFDDPLARRIYAGADTFLMPSRYEPCGLGQMIALRYGTIPIVRSTGGLADTVMDYDPIRRQGNGFCFQPYESGAMAAALGRALQVYRDPLEWGSLQQQIMTLDFSWGRSAKDYLDLYKSLLGKN